MAWISSRSRVRRRLRAAGALALSAATLTGVPAVARADGDPASDVLVAAPPLFISASSGASYAQKATVAAQLDAAARAGHRLRVAVISQRIDLGSVGALWGRPQAYAEFLGRELSVQYGGELLVVMPDGFGVSRAGDPVDTVLSGLAPRSGQLFTATEQAVQRLTGTGAVRGARITGGVEPSRTGGAGWWVATVAAVAIVAAAWTASLRRRPPRSRRTSHASA